MKYLVLTLSVLLSACGGGGEYSEPAAQPKAVFGPTLRACEAPEAPCPGPLPKAIRK